VVDTVIGTEDAERADIPQTERVLLAASGSFAGLAAARWLIARARTHALSVQVSVAPDALPGIGDEGPDPAAAAQRVREYLQLVEPAIESDVVLLSADREADVLDATLETDLLVLTTTVADPEHEVRPGSFASRVAMQAGCATVIVPRAWTPADGPIVVGVGDGVGEYAALDRAAAEAQQQDRCLVLLRASRLSPTVDRSVPGDLDVEFADSLDSQSLEDALNYVVDRYPAVSARPVQSASAPLKALIEQGRDAALIVVGSAIAADADGADVVARGLAEQPPCAVMVVPPGQAAAS
jgi:hypothetical protein